MTPDKKWVELKLRLNAKLMQLSAKQKIFYDDYKRDTTTFNDFIEYCAYVNGFCTAIEIVSLLDKECEVSQGAERLEEVDPEVSV